MTDFEELSLVPPPPRLIDSSRLALVRIPIAERYSTGARRAVLSALVLIVFALRLSPSPVRFFLLDQIGQKVLAEVESITPLDQDHRIAYRFQAADPQTGSQSQWSGTGLRSGHVVLPGTDAGGVPVVYDPRNPALNRLTGNRGMMILFLPGALGACCLAVLLWSLGIRNRRRALDLLLRGRGVLARIRRVEPVGAPEDPWFEIAVEFETREGTLVQHEGRWPGGGNPQPLPDQSLVLFHDPGDPTRCMILEYDFEGIELDDLIR